VIYILKGMRLVFGDRQFRPYVWRPLLISLALFIAILVAGYLLLLPLFSGWAHHFGMSSFIGAIIATLVYILVLWFFSVTIYLTLAGLVSSWLWGALSEKVESTLRPVSPMNFPPFLVDAIPRTLFSLFIVFCTLVGGFFGVWPAILFAGWLSLYDYTSSYYLRRRIPFGRQFTLVYENRRWASFAFGCGMLTLIPFLNIILLPALVAGGTLMCVESEMGLGNTRVPN
jgi:CysZ protein